MEQSMQNESQPVQMAAPIVKKSCGHTPLIVLLTILALGGIGFGGFELYQNLQNNNKPAATTETKCDVKEEETTDEIITGKAAFNVPNPIDDMDQDGEVRTYYGVGNDILSIYSISDYLHPYGHIVSEVKAENIDLKTGKKIKNDVMLEQMGFTVADAYRAMLTDIASNENLDSILLNTMGDVSGESISVKDFKKNIDDYVETLGDDTSKFYVFLKNKSVAVAYQQYEILEMLGMGTHMGAGLKFGYTEILLNEDTDEDSDGGWIDCQPPLTESQAEKCEKAEKEGYPKIAY